MNVSQAVAARKSVRAFLETPVANEVLVDLLTKAARSPSGGNLQPWKVYVLGADRMPDFLDFLATREGEQAEYDIYPPKLWEPYRTNRFALGEAMYATMGISRDDKPARLDWLANNYRFFGAPQAFFCFVERKMGPPQWSDLGMFLQSFMLLATEAGLATCPQESWAAYPQAVAEFVGAPAEQMLFCGMAVGYADTEHPVNSLESQRMPFAAWGTIV
jgi:nitroreductase